ncbi:DNA mismatch endonuclease Vsr [Alphaproteobacteria bacterium GH1-50]|uniref:Very short patch repair endonuclease n=1 Tax=Kangsaoukella pontilimi TaxID=2691042 RepID=A0A7C9IQM4_9RHOB|nr:DNA mismatch endonuclease Vsr [Kangsaoukella pontilimi]MXQ07883.1 DNA mismatch endonuclease Vsr [Kangsaoukella pontilimi]
MADRITKERRSENMRRIRSKDMKPEMHVRRIVHGMGYRFRLHRKDLPGKPDLVFGPRKAVVFVHGCFWHQHNCRAGRIPSSNSDYWTPKLARNVERDVSARTALEEAGWRVLVVWECELKDEAAIRKRLRRFLGPAGATRGNTVC